MVANLFQTDSSPGVILVLGATGKTGHRVADRLRAQRQPIRLGSRRGIPAFDWTQPTCWEACLHGVEAVYLNYPSDLPIPGSDDHLAAFVAAAQCHGVQRLVLLSGRGEADAHNWEAIIQGSHLDWTILRASWFCQNFSEGAFADMVQAGCLTLPAGSIPEPFVDVNDIADVAVAALTEPNHGGQIYEVTGPRLLTFTEATAELSAAMGHTIQYQQIPHDAFLGAVADSGAPQHVIWLMDHLFGTVLDGRNAYVGDGVQRALGRPPQDFAEFAREFATTSTWRTVPCNA